MIKRIAIVLLTIVMLLFSVACDGASDHDATTTTTESSENTIQFTFETEGVKGESMSNIWIGPKSLDNGKIIPGFEDDLTNKDNWPTLLENTSHLKLYIEYLGYALKPELRKIADFVKENKLQVTVEVGGVRLAPESVPDNEIGRYVAEKEFLVLSKFLLVGGRVDYITTDHSLASEITGRTSERPNMTMQDYM